MFLDLQQVLELDIGLSQDLLESDFPLILKGEEVSDLQLAFADNAASDRHPFLGGVMLDVVRALVLVASAVDLVSAIGV